MAVPRPLLCFVQAEERERYVTVTLPLHKLLCFVQAEEREAQHAKQMDELHQANARIATLAFAQAWRRPTLPYSSLPQTGNAALQ